MSLTTDMPIWHWETNAICTVVKMHGKFDIRHILTPNNEFVLVDFEVHLIQLGL